MEIKFTKMHGLGNDFVIIDAINQDVSLDAKQIQFIAGRHFGIGCDQVLLVEKSQRDDADFRYKIYNAIGEIDEQCGNGARCFAQFLHDEGLSDKTEIPVSTRDSRIVLYLQSNREVTVDMGLPNLNPEDIPFLTEQIKTTYEINIADGIADEFVEELTKEIISLSVVSMGNPHAVIIVDDVDTTDVERIGKLIQNHKCFPDSVNVGFLQIIDSTHAKLRVYERIIGETFACGSGSCAAVVTGRLQGFLDETVELQLLGGKITIHWEGNKSSVMMTGPTATVFKGKISL
ncbi:MAG: diaminopimelate epimerase [Cocleimonas sp.]|jgi:diaminopimelate epimerase